MSAVESPRVVGSLSPSRAADFLSCPLMFRFRTVDRLPEPSSPDAVRGTLVHKVLEDIFDLPAAERTPRACPRHAPPRLGRAPTAEEPRAATILEGLDEDAWLASAQEAVDRWFELEDPTRLEPAEREAFVECLLDSGLMLRGVIDRIDVAPDGAVRVVDYKGLALDTPLPTPTGWTTMGEVRVGDMLIGSDGRPTRVLNKSELHHRPCYRLRFRDGSEVVSDNVHLWSVVQSHRQLRRSRVVDTDDLANLHDELCQAGRRSVPMDRGGGTDRGLRRSRSFPVDPWILGAWLGDGDARAGHLTVGADDIDDMVVMLKERWRGDVRLRREKSAYRAVLSKQEDKCTFGHSDWLPATSGHGTRRCARGGEHSSMAAWNLSLSRDLACPRASPQQAHSREVPPCRP